jgi:hypothetical protein
MPGFGSHHKDVPPVREQEPDSYAVGPLTIVRG